MSQLIELAKLHCCLGRTINRVDCAVNSITFYFTDGSTICLRIELEKT